MAASAGADGGAAMCRAPSKDAVRGSPLHWACAAGQLDAALTLIELGADVNAADHMGTVNRVALRNIPLAPSRSHVNSGDRFNKRVR